MTLKQPVRIKTWVSIMANSRCDQIKCDGRKLTKTHPSQLTICKHANRKSIPFGQAMQTYNTLFFLTRAFDKGSNGKACLEKIVLGGTDVESQRKLDLKNN